MGTNGNKTVEFDTDTVPKGDYLGTFKLKTIMKLKMDSKCKVHTHTEILKFRDRVWYRGEKGGEPCIGKTSFGKLKFTRM